MAGTSSGSNRTRYARLSHASLIVIPKMLQELLMSYEPPVCLLHDCTNILYNRYLNSTERQQVKHAKENGYGNFDIPLIYKLLRNLNLAFPEPSKGWESQVDPSSSEVRDGDDLERCRRSRNDIVHKGNSNVGNEEFLKYFKSFKDIARRLERKLNRRNKEFLSEIEFLETCCMDEEMEQKYLEELRVYKVTISQLKDTVQVLSTPNEEGVEFISTNTTQKYVEGEKVTLECLVATDGNVKAVWLKQNDKMPSDAVIESKNLSLKVTFPKVTQQHAGIYTVNIGNEKWDVELNVIERVSSLTLRDYQHELAEVALSGKNTIVCAGTNTGKTHVAFYVIENHLLKNPEGKVLFINGTNVLLEQQYQKACDLMTALYQQDKIYKWEAGKDFDKNFLEKLQNTSLLFLTPKSLSNHLGENVDTKVCIDVFTLLVFDECHHTYSKDLYNEVMKYYRIEKFERGTAQLPQILGLTASPGTNKSTNEESAIVHLKTLMANLSVSMLSVVRKHEEEIKQYSATPYKVSIQSKTREDDPVKKILLKAIADVENALHDRKVKDFLTNNPAITRILEEALQKPPVDKTDSRYIQWMAETKVKIEKVLHKDPEVPRLLHSCIRHLELYADCLEVNSLLEIDQVREILSDGYGKLLYEGQAANTDAEENVVSKLKEVYTDIFKLGRDLEGNPDINEIVKAMKEEYDKMKEQSRFLIFVKTRATAKALAERLPDYLRSTHLTGSHASTTEGGISINEQLDVVKRFKEGTHLCIVATSVGCEGLDIQQCNLMIRYRFHADEISSLQMRGRIRQQEGKEVILATDIDLAREIQNIERQCLMKQAIKTVTEQDLVRQVTLTERHVYDTEEAERKKMKMKISKKKRGKFTINCRCCGLKIIEGDLVRHIKEKHYIICCKDILARITRKTTETKKKKFDGVQKQDKVYGECQHNWGSILIFHKLEFVSLSQDYIKFFDVKKDEYLDCRKWSDLTFMIDEISENDITEYDDTVISSQDINI